MKKTLLLGFAIAAAVLFLLPGAAHAIGVVYMTPITAEGAANTCNYTDDVGNPKAQVNTTNIQTNTMAIYGIKPSSYGNPTDLSTRPGVAVTYTYTVHNDGNTTDRFYLTQSTTYGATAGNGWTTAIRNSLDNGDITYLDVAEDSELTFKIKVTPSSSSATDYAPDGSSAWVTAVASSHATPVGQYTGANGTTYGNVASATDTDITTIVTSKMTMSRTAIVDAPTAYTGGAHDSVPGAIITYVILISSEGGSDARSVIIIDKVSQPNESKPFHMGMTGSVTNAAITAGAPTAPDWNAFYSTLDSPTTTYEGANVTGAWTAILQNRYLPNTAKWVKWEKAVVYTTEDAKTLTWGITIK